MRDVLKIIAFILGVVLLGALLAPLLYWAAHALEPFAISHGWLKFDAYQNEVIIRGPLSFLAAADFHKFFDRGVMIAALILLRPMAEWMEVHSWADLQMRPDPRRWGHFFRGLIVGGGLVALLGAVYIFLVYYELKEPVPWGLLPKLAITAIVVAVLEELIFRGAIEGLLLRKMRPFGAIFWTTLIFAVIHFLKPDPGPPVQHVTWYSAFPLIPRVFHQFVEPAALIGSLTTLLVLGWTLAYVRWKTQSLWMGIGLHAGVVFVKMSFSKLATHRITLQPWVGPELQTGLVPVFLLLFALVILWRRLEYEELLPTPRKRD